MHGINIESAIEILIRRIYYFLIPHSFPRIVLDYYRRVGKHYDVPVWLFRDAVLSNYCKLNQDKYGGYLNFTLHMWQALVM